MNTLRASDLFQLATDQAKSYRDRVVRDQQHRQTGLRSETAAPESWVEACVVPSTGRESGQLRTGDK